MKGIFNLSFKQGEGDEASVTACNHLTLDGMDVLFNRRYLNQPALTAPASARYRNNLNYFFLVVDDGQPLGFDIDSRDVKFADIARFPNSYQNDASPYNPNDDIDGAITIYHEEGQSKTLNVLAVGLGFKEVGGDGSNDFVWSIAKVDSSTIIIPDYGTDGVGFWRMTYSYRVVFAGNVVPEITVNVGGENFTFYKDALGDERAVGMFINAGSITERLDFDIATFTVNGARFTPPSEFKEIKTTDPYMRKFEITYTNKRSTNPVDITGFALMLSGNIFSYRLEHDKYIVLQPGKKFKITIAVGIEIGHPGGIVNNNLKFAPSPFYYSDLGDVTQITTWNDKKTKVDKVVVTGRAGIAGERVNTFVNQLDDVYGVDLSDLPYQGVVNSELTKLEYSLQGVATRPVYTVLGGNPSVINIIAPNLSAADCGWRVEAGQVVFRINVPADITHMQVAVDDGVWFDYPVTAGASNDIVLAKRFIYNGWFYVRWKNNALTGQISKYMGLFKSGALIVEPFYRYLPTSYMQSNNRKFYTQAGLCSSAYPAANFPSLDSSNSNGSFSVTAKRGFHNATNGGSSDYSGTWTNNSYTLKNSVLLFQSDLTLKACPEITSGTYALNGNEAALPWKLRATRPAAEDVAVVVPRTNIPRSPALDLKPYPTVELPSKVSIYGTLEARKAEIISLPGNVSLYTAEAAENGQLIEFNITDKLFNHLEYGIRYLNEAGTAPLNSAVVKFKGESLDIPDVITDYAYNAQTQTITFTTPARAVRASIKQFNIEVFAFECVPGGVTSFYMSQPLNMTQRYELWLYNENDETWTEPYVMVDVDENDEKPTSTGPYGYPEWTPAGTEDTINVTDMGTFADIKRWNAYNFNVKIDGVVADQFIERNEHGVITKILFNAGMKQFTWSTGYQDGSVDYNANPGSSFAGLLYMTGTEPMVIDVWHEWEKYSLINEASYGKYNSGVWTPYYGQTTGKFQKVEIVNGYIRNTLRFRMYPSTKPKVCPLYHLKAETYSSLYRNAGIYIHARDLIGSYYFNQTQYKVESFVPIIDGKAAKWDLTKDVDGNVTKARCFNNEQIAFVYDTVEPDNGWICENYDPELDGQPGSEAIYHTLEFCLSKGIWDGQLMSYARTGQYGVKPLNADGDFPETTNSNAIFAKVNPYAPLSDFNSEIGSVISTMSYNNNPSSNHVVAARFQDALVTASDYDAFTTQLADSYVYANGTIGTMTREEVTLDYKPSLVNLGRYFTDWQGEPNNIIEPTLEPYTYNAVVLTFGTLVVSNRKNPYVWQVDSGQPGNTNVKVAFARKSFTTEQYSIDTVGSSVNMSTAGAYYNPKGQYWASWNMILYAGTGKLLKFEDDLQDPSSAVVDESKSKFNNKMLHNLVLETVNFYFYYDWDANLWVVSNGTLEPMSGLIKIDGVPYTLSVHPDLITTLTAAGYYPAQRESNEYIIKITNTVDPTKYIEYNLLGNEKWVGFTSGIHTLSFNANGYDGADATVAEFAPGIVDSAINGFRSATSFTLDEVGYKAIKDVNYVVSDIGTGLKTDFNIMPFTLLDEETWSESFNYAEHFNSSFKEKAEEGGDGRIAIAINNYYLNGDMSAPPSNLNVKLNGRVFDRCEYYEFEDTEAPAEGELDRINRTEPLLYTGLRYFWDAENIGLDFKPWGNGARIYTDIANMTIPEMYNGPQLYFEILATSSVEEGYDHPFVNSDRYTDLAQNGLPVTEFIQGNLIITSVTNGLDIWSKLEISIGTKPILEVEWDERIGPGYFDNLSPTTLRMINPSTLGNELGGGIIGPGPMNGEPIGPGPGLGNSPLEYRESKPLVPNYFQYPDSAFAVTVNGKPATFSGGLSKLYDKTKGSLRLDTALPYISYGSNGDFSVVRNMYEDGTLEGLGDISEFYNRNYAGPNGSTEWVEPSDPPPVDPRIETGTVVGKYIYRVNKDHFGGNYNFENVAHIVCEQLGLVLIYDWDYANWEVYTGDNHVDYVVEVKYKQLYNPLDGNAPPVLLGTEIDRRDVYAPYKALLANNVRLVPNSQDTTKFELSWITRVKSYVTSMGFSGYFYKGGRMPGGASLTKNLSTNPRIDETFFSLPIAGVTIENLAVTIDDEPARLDLTNYTPADALHRANMFYNITEVAEDNMFPAYGSMGSFTASTPLVTVKYDVATGSWSVTAGFSGTVIVGLTTIKVGETQPDFEFNGNAASNGFSCVAYNTPYLGYGAAFSLRGLPGNTTEPTELLDTGLPYGDFIDNYVIPMDAFIAPNYELFDAADFTLGVNDNAAVAPVVTNDTHGVPILYEWLVNSEHNVKLTLDRVNRTFFFNVEDITTIPIDYYISRDRLPLDLVPNDETKILIAELMFVFQWNYTKLLDIHDPRPLFVSDNTSNIYTYSELAGAAPSVVTQGTKKAVSLAWSYSLDPLGNVMIGGMKDQMVYGWLNNLYTGEAFTINETSAIFDGLAPMPLNSPSTQPLPETILNNLPGDASEEMM